ncbi:MAG: hypothetical protein KGM96_13585 [Acidobacteriota bacterium]|nr:hypothetical protein [Acidobacteriota bacterium]
MPVSPALRRLLRIRELEEEQSRLALESAVGELSSLEQALTETAGRDRQGRQLVSFSAQSGELPDRLAGLEESRAALRLGAALEERRNAAEQEAERLRQSFLIRRVERLQAETLIETREATDAIEAKRRGQQALDDWHRSRSFPAESKARPNVDAERASGRSLPADRGDESAPADD